METIVLIGTITTKTPFTTSPLECVERSGCQMLPRMPIHKDGITESRPVIPAAGQRGVFRRSATDILVEVARKKRSVISIEDYLLWSSGGVKGSGKTSGTLAEDPLFRFSLVERSPLLAVFGAGASPAGFVASGLSVSPAIPNSAVDTVIIDGARRHELKSERYAAVAKLGVLPKEELIRADLYAGATAKRSGIDAEIKKLAGTRRKASPDQHAVIDSQISSRKQQRDEAMKEMEVAGGSDNALGRPLPGYEVIPPGVDLASTLRLRTPNKHAFGFLLASLEKFSEHPRFGAHEAAGCGFVKCNWRVSKDGKEIGRVKVDEFAFEIEGDFLKQALASWQEDLDIEFTRANLNDETKKLLTA